MASITDFCLSNICFMVNSVDIYNGLHWYTYITSILLYFTGQLRPWIIIHAIYILDVSAILFAYFSSASVFVEGFDFLVSRTICIAIFLYRIPCFSHLSPYIKATMLAFFVRCSFASDPLVSNICSTTMNMCLLNFWILRNQFEKNLRIF